LLPDYLAVSEDFQPEFGNLLVVEVVMLDLLLLGSQQLPNLLKISITKAKLPLDDIIDLLDKRRIQFPKLALNLLLLPGKCSIQPPLLHEVAVDGDSLHLFPQRGQLLDLGLHLLLDLQFLLLLAAGLRLLAAAPLHALFVPPAHQQSL
jgi:hypothetical protein